MISKTFEIRDVGTFMPVLAVKLQPGNDNDRYLLARSGYGTSPTEQASYVMVWRLEGGGNSLATTDIYDSSSDTMRIAHQHIIENFEALESGSVICCEFITGRRAAPKLSERVTT